MAFAEERRAAHLVKAHGAVGYHPSVTGDAYNDYVRDAARRQVGAKRWNRYARRWSPWTG